MSRRPDAAPPTTRHPSTASLCPSCGAVQVTPDPLRKEYWCRACGHVSGYTLDRQRQRTDDQRRAWAQLRETLREILHQHGVPLTPTVDDVDLVHQLRLRLLTRPRE